MVGLSAIAIAFGVRLRELSAQRSSSSRLSQEEGVGAASHLVHANGVAHPHAACREAQR